MVKKSYPVRLAIVASHPIQYNSPLFRCLSKSNKLKVKVFYSWEGTCNKIDPEFKQKITWDIPLLEGYDFTFVKNRSKDPGTHHFVGLDNPDMCNKIEKWGATAVLVYGWAFKTHLEVLRHFSHKIPVFFRGDSTMQTGGNTLRLFIRKYFLKWVYRHVDIVFYPGIKSRKYYKYCGLGDSRLKLVPHSVDNTFFSLNSTNYEQLASIEKKKLNIPESALVLLFAAKMVPRKQPMFLLQAVTELQRQNGLRPIHLIYVGTGPLLEDIKKSASGLSNVHFLGFKNQTQMPIVYRLGDVYVLPSTIEAWGLSVNEAMACSRPVLVSDRVGCAPDLVKPDISGDIFSANDLQQLKTIIKSYALDKNKLESMKKSAKDLIGDWAIERASTLIESNILSICKYASNEKQH